MAISTSVPREAGIRNRNSVTTPGSRPGAGMTVAVALVILMVLGAPTAAHAQQYPRKPISLVVPFPPGAATDAFARIVARRMSDELNQPFVVLNRDGAAGVIGTDSVARAAPGVNGLW